MRVDDDLLRLPYLRPIYDEPEFVVRNVWRLYGGWWDGNPAHLKPAPEAALADRAGDAGRRRRRGWRRGAEVAGERRPPAGLPPRRAGGDGGARGPDVHATRADLYERRRRAETSLMTKGIFAAAVRESRAIAPAAPDE